MSPSDPDLLQRYADAGSQEAFTALVKRHLDLVYSAARRQVHSPQLAEEIAQSVFLDLSRKAATLKPEAPLVAWLYLVTRRTAIDVIRRESRRQAREQTAHEIAAMNSAPAWPQVEPLLDEAMESLGDTDRSAVLLRYFENRSLREVGQSLGTSEDAAQKRVSRAVDQLRTFLVQRGVTVTAAGLATDLSANAIQTAPVALGVSISATAALGTIASQVVALETSKTIAMTLLQKTVLTAALALIVGGAFFEANHLRQQRAELAASRQGNDNLAAQVRRAGEQQAIALRQLDEARQSLAALRAIPAPQPSAADLSIESTMKTLLARFTRLKGVAATQPELTIPEFGLLTDQDWFTGVQRMKSDSDDEMRAVFRGLRGQAKVRFSLGLASAMVNYVKAHQGLLPADPRELLPYFDANPTFARPPDEAMLQRYALLYSGAASEVPVDERNHVLVEITSPDEDNDQRTQAGVGYAAIRDFRDLTADTHYARNAFAQAHGGTAPQDAVQLLPYFKPALSPARQQKFLQTAGSQPSP